MHQLFNTFAVCIYREIILKIQTFSWVPKCLSKQHRTWQHDQDLRCLPFHKKIFKICVQEGSASDKG